MNLSLGWSLYFSFFSPIFFSSKFFLTYFAHYLAIFLLIKRFPGVLPAFEHAWLLYWSNSQHGDCSIRVSRSCSSSSRSICWFNSVCDYASRSSIFIFAMQNRLSYSSQTPIFPNFYLRIFPEFCSLLLASYFSKKKLLAKSVQPYLSLIWILILLNKADSSLCAIKISF